MTYQKFFRKNRAPQTAKLPPLTLHNPTTLPYETLDCAKLDNEAAARLTRWARLRPVVTYDDDAALGQLRLTYDPSIPLNTHILETITLKLGGETIHVSLSQVFFAQVLKFKSIDPGCPPNALPSDLAALILEHLLTPLIESVEKAIKTTLTVEAISTDLAAPPDALPVRVEGDVLDAPVHAMFWADTPAGSSLLDTHIARLGSALPSPPTIDHIGIPTSLLSGGFAMPISTLRALRVGDGVMLDPAWTPDRTLHLQIGGHYRASCHKSDGGVTLDTVPTHQFTTEGLTMDANEVTDIIDLDALPITLSIELDRREITISALSELTAGSVVQFSDAPPTSVRILANGKSFAEGTLVLVEGRHGVRVTQVGKNPG